MNRKILAIGIIATFLFSCQSKENTETSEVNEVKLISPVFNADSAFAYTKAQVDFGPRIPSTPEHLKTLQYLVAKFKSFGAEVMVQEASATKYDKKKHTLNSQL